MRMKLELNEPNNDTIVFCRGALQLNLLCFITDELDIIVELNGINLN